MPNAGYEYLLCYKLTVPIYDYTVEFCRRWIDPRSRTTDQMIQAARSGMQNILEGNKQQGLKGYIKLTGVARGSLTELLEDYQAFARQNELPIWGKEKAIRKIGEIGELWEMIKKIPALPDSPNFPDFPKSSVVAVNLMITLVHQANYLIDKLIVSLKERHRTHGGLTEELYQARIRYRGNMGDWGNRGEK